ncbi:unnamed protein product [Amoebophrya sp. A25]|nr:unnamed protein product [Amoebophrya sp. A25]|eukprot:GSA25T00004061001.1
MTRERESKRSRCDSDSPTREDCFPQSPYLRSQSILRNWDVVPPLDVQGQDAPSPSSASSSAPSTSTPSTGSSAYNPFRLGEGAIFVGHVNTDLDSVAGAIGAAALFNGTPAISEENLNGEILFALKASGFAAPELFSKIEDRGSRNICLVDHTEPKQMVPEIREKLMQNIVGVIDHHALARSFATDSPIFMDLRPWGSMSTIVTHLFLQLQLPISKSLAQLLMSAILSDTLNLRGPTTTKEDRFAVTLLALRAGFGSEEEVTAYAHEMFTAKTQWIASLGAKSMCRADCKEFTATAAGGDADREIKFGIAVLEIAGVASVLFDKAPPEEICQELEVVKKEKNLAAIFLCIVDVLAQGSVVVLVSETERKICDKAFPGTADISGQYQGVVNDEECPERVRTLGPYVSRKKEFMPRFTKAVTEVL